MPRSMKVFALCVLVAGVQQEGPPVLTAHLRDQGGARRGAADRGSVHVLIGQEMRVDVVGVKDQKGIVLRGPGGVRAAREEAGRAHTDEDRGDSSEQP